MSYRDVFDVLNADNISYVVPRKYENLPDSPLSPGDDVDLIIPEDHLGRATSKLESIGFSRSPDEILSRAELMKRAVEDPRKALKVVANGPLRAVGRFIDGAKTIEHHNPFHRNIHVYRNGQHLDIRSNLAYKSPRNERRFPVHPDVTTGMLARRREYENFYIPSPADELAHLIPHCLFDKGGYFSEYYQDRCNTLFDQIRDDPCQFDLLEDLLQAIFYDADTVVMEALYAGEYETLFSDMKAFAEY